MASRFPPSCRCPSLRSRNPCNHAQFTFIDGDHHAEEWTYVMPDGKTSRAHIELARTK